MSSPLTLLFLLGAVFAGSLIPIQTGFNTQLARALQSPIHSSIAIFVVGLAALAAYVVVVRIPLPTTAQIASVPVAAWTGGLLALTYILLLITLAPKLGAVPTVACVVLGQILCSTIIDHYGLLGFEVHPINWLRVGGIGLLLLGVVLVRLS